MDILRPHFLINCKEYTNETYHFDNYGVNETVELSKIIVLGTPWSDSNEFCQYEKEFFDILVDKRFGKFNVTYRKFKLSPQILFDIYPNIDLALAQTTIEDWHFQFATSPWIRRETEIMILSALYFYPSGLFKQLMITFSLTTWLAILLSILIISMSLYAIQLTTSSTDKKLFKRDYSLLEIIILVCSYLLNNSSKMTDNFLLTIWAFASLVLVSCLSGNILSSLVNQDMTTINTFQELIDSNISIIGGKWSYFDVFNKTWPGLEKIKKLNERAEFVDDYNQIISDEIIERVANRKAAYLREGYAISKLINQNPHKSVAVGEEGFLSVLIGYFVNKKLNKNRITIYKLFQRTVEVGIFQHWDATVTLIDQLYGYRKTEQYYISNNFNKNSEESKVYIIRTDMLINLFVFLVSAYGFCLGIFFLELNRFFCENSYSGDQRYEIKRYRRKHNLYDYH